MKNLLKETLEILKENNKTEEDVLWCSVTDIDEYHHDFENAKEGYFGFEEFKKWADKNYDSGYGGQEVHPRLFIVGKDFWLERHEYDGSEWWEFKTMLLKPEKEVELSNRFIFEN